MLWHIKLLRILPGLWICRSYSIWWKLDFCQLCNLTAGCNFNNQLLFTAFCLSPVGWIKANRVSSLPNLFCPLTVETICPRKVSVVLYLFNFWCKTWFEKLNSTITNLPSYLLYVNFCYCHKSNYSGIASKYQYSVSFRSLFVTHRPV